MSIYLILIILFIVDRLVALINSFFFKIKYVPLLINAGNNNRHKRFVQYFFIIMGVIMIVCTLVSAVVNAPSEKVFDPYPYWSFIFTVGLLVQQIFFEMKYNQSKAPLIRGIIDGLVLISLVIIF